jgi:hypothetical protein
MRRGVTSRIDPRLASILILLAVWLVSSFWLVTSALAQQGTPTSCDPSHPAIPVIDAANYALDGGFTGENTVIIVSVAWAESGGNPFACLYNPPSGSQPGSWDRGILQINSYYHAEVTDACAFDPACAFDRAYGIPFRQWVTFLNGRYTEFFTIIGSAPLSNGIGDGSLSVTLDRCGAFGSATAADDAYYDPAGALGRSGTTFQSALYFSPLGFFLNISNGMTGGSIDCGRFTFISRGEARSVFSAQAFDFELTQALGTKSDQGSTLTQVYRVTNHTGNTQSFDFIRHFDGDLYFDGTLRDIGGASSDGGTIFEFDSGDNPLHPSTFVGITNEGGDHIGYRIAPYWFADDIISYKSAVLNNTITNDFNGDRIIDYPYDVTLSLGNRFSNIAHGDTVSFATKTIFGSGSPIARAALPTGVVPAVEYDGNINQGDSHWYDFINNFIQDLWVVVGFGSEFDVRVYAPNGSLYREERSMLSPITIAVPNAQPGQWRFEITAIATPYPNDPYVVVVGVRENRPPVAIAGPDQTVECASHNGSVVTLDGSLSVDPDGDVLTFEWRNETNQVIGTTAILNNVVVPLGTHAFTLTVTDTGGLTVRGASS